MTITNDAFGNFYIGNFIAGTILDWTEVLSAFRQALGSNDRANILSSGLSAARIDWRPNLIEETRTGVIPVLGVDRLHNINSVDYTLATNSRLALAYASSSGFSSSLFATGTANLFTNAHVQMTILSTDNFWMVANKQSISYFVYRSPSFYYFFTQGFLLNSALGFPENAYALYSSVNTNGQALPAPTQCHSRGFAGSLIKTIHTSTIKANYAHTKLSDGLGTQSEVELYLRDSSTDIPYGFIPNIFKWRVDGSEVAPAIGDTVRLNMANATGEYVGQGNIFCKVVGRLGNTSGTDLTGDYLLMRVAA
jgi:hypothetical protein